MASFHLTLFGSFLAEWQGRPLSFRSDKIRALLAYLVVESGAAHDRSALANLLWSEKTEPDAHNNLRVSLSRLRRTLRPVSQGLGSEVLDIGPQTVQLRLPADAARCYIDVRIFDELMRTCANHPHRALTHCQVCNRRLRQAAALYQGEFLPALSVLPSPVFAEWQQRKQEHYQDEMVLLLKALATHEQLLGDWSLAEQSWRRLVQFVPWEETAHRALMGLLAERGEREGALAQYEQCRHILRTELGIPPSHETIELADALRTSRTVPQQRKPSQTMTDATLPQPTTPFVGRTRELRQLKQTLLDPAYRLVVITGPGGAGKTRLALAVTAQIAAYFEDGVRLVSLADTQNYEQGPVLPHAVAHALRLDLNGRQSPARQVLDYLHSRDIFLLLDNLEHLMGEEAFIVDLLQHTKRVTLLVTSRERLSVQAAYNLPLAGLDVPPAHVMDVESALTFDSVRLFNERAMRQPQAAALDDGNVGYVARICRLVEGLPLALELAAAWAGYLTYVELCQTVAENMDMLGVELVDMPARQRSIRATLDSSWQLLAPPLQTNLRQLAVFRGGFQREAALKIANTTLNSLNALIDKSLLRRDNEGRYNWHPLVQQFAEQKLQRQPDAQRIYHAHARFYLTLVADQELALTGWQPREAADRLRIDWENIQQAIAWAAPQGDLEAVQGSLAPLSEYFVQASLTEMGISLFHAIEKWINERNTAPPPFLSEYIRIHLARCLLTQGKTNEALQVIDQVLRVDERVRLPTLLLVTAYLHRGRCLQQQARFAEAQEILEKALQLAQTDQLIHIEAQILGNLAGVYGARHHFDAAKSCLEKAEGLAHEIGNRRLLCHALSILNSIHFNQGDYERSLEISQRVVAISQEMDFRVGQSQGLYLLAGVYRQLGALREARQAAERALLSVEERGHPYEQMVIRQQIALMHNDMGLHYQAYHELLDLLHTCREGKWRWQEVDILTDLTRVLCHLGDYQRANHYFQEAEQLAEEIGALEFVFLGMVGGYLLNQRGEYDAATAYCLRGWEVGVASGNKFTQACAQLYLGWGYAGINQWPESETAFRLALDLFRQTGQHHRALEARAGLAHTLLQNQQIDQAEREARPVWESIQSGNIDGLEDLGMACLVCCHTLRAQGNTKLAQQIIIQTAHIINARAQKIADDRLRRCYVEGVKAHQEILLTASKRSKSH